MQHRHFHSSATGRRSADTTKCCGVDCDAPFDGSHFFTLLCGTMHEPLVVLPTSTINASPNFGPLLQNVVCVTNTLTFVRQDVPHPVSTETTESTAQLTHFRGVSIISGKGIVPVQSISVAER